MLEWELVESKASKLQEVLMSLLASFDICESCYLCTALGVINGYQRLFYIRFTKTLLYT